MRTSRHRAVTGLSYRLVVYAGSFVVLTVIYAIGYQWGMATLEGESRSWYHALEVVIQSMTTTGYGQDAPWETLEMTAFMVLIQSTGIAYIFVAVPLFFVPWLQTLVEPTPPSDVAELDGHVVVVGYTPLCESLVDELRTSGTDYVVLEGDEERAQSLHEDGLVVLHGDPASAAALEDAQVDDALAVVVDASETEHISSVIELCRRDEEPRVLALVVDPGDSRYLRYAGAEEVLSPKHRLGKALGDKVRPVVDIELEDAAETSATSTTEFDDDLRLREFPLDDTSEFYGEPLSNCGRLESVGVTILGAWVRGDFLRSLPADVHVDENTTLLIAGTPDTLESVTDESDLRGSSYRPQREPVVVAGTGTVGASVIGTLARSGIDTTVLDIHDDEIVDVVGDATTEDGLLEAGVPGAGTLILALGDDLTTLLATLVARELNPDLEILAAVTRTGNVVRLRDAGANYTLGLSNVAGRMLALRIFEYETMTFSDQLQIRTVEITASLDESLEGDTIGQQTGCVVIALERDGGLRPTREGESFTPPDRLVVAGTEEEIERLRKRVGS
ncbi:potassium channel family protein [Natronorubrum daqingense]|uniref:Potassium transporter TrkA n=1 Tax=Natronorubrum daqingense TaxID=588898 RepID=A0A1N6YBN7_9EURY|nr:NAD-binding protein [Natronorubrum daqingense]APX95716.1 potassium transporter TrkA [Natronorubrum daqingense]SIR11963.1 Trk K+ transport system, NAD-binding component [Natronorubrum daqingense]